MVCHHAICTALLLKYIVLQYLDLGIKQQNGLSPCNLHCTPPEVYLSHHPSAPGSGLHYRLAFYHLCKTLIFITNHSEIHSCSSSFLNFIFKACIFACFSVLEKTPQYDGEAQWDTWLQLNWIIKNQNSRPHQQQQDLRYSSSQNSLIFEPKSAGEKRNPSLPGPPKRPAHSQRLRVSSGRMKWHWSHVPGHQVCWTISPATACRMLITWSKLYLSCTLETWFSPSLLKWWPQVWITCILV